MVIFSIRYIFFSVLQIQTMDKAAEKNKYSNRDSFLVELQSKGREIGR